MLDGHDPPAGEAAAVAAALHLVDDRRVEVAAAQEVGVQGMHETALDGARCRHQGMPEHLPAEHLGRAEVAADAAKEVELDSLQVQQLQQFGEAMIHAGSVADRRGQTPPWHLYGTGVREGSDPSLRLVLTPGGLTPALALP